METTYRGYTPTIGIEVHAELKTKTKMFCNSKNEPHAQEPNIHICPVCMGHPGTLPVVNKEAVLHVLKVGSAVEGAIADYTEFDRKNYFYPDIPKGYQISQYEYPLVKGGVLANVALTRIHLEEDTARSQHDQGDGSLIDYNRAGVPLMELVTEPVIHDGETAGNFARELQLLLRTLGVSSANMEKGEMRVEANISVSKSLTFGTKVEVKNLNSFKAVEAAIAYEVKRQADLIEEGGTVIQETRGWDESKGKTFSQRLKESADDYRYFPDPDIPKFKLSIKEELLVSRLNENMPILPNQKRKKYSDLGIPREQIEYIISNEMMDLYFANIEKIATPEILRRGANYLTSDVASLLNSGVALSSTSYTQLVELMKMLVANEITSRSAKDMLLEVISADSDPRLLAKERNLVQSHDTEALRVLVREIISQNETVVSEYKAGKETSIQFLIGQGMKLSKGTANPGILKEILVEEME